MIIIIMANVTTIMLQTVEDINGSLMVVRAGLIKYPLTLL